MASRKQWITTLGLIGALVLPCYASTPAPLDLSRATIQDIHARMRAGKLTCSKLMGQTIERIKRYNLAMNRGAPINAIVRINPSLYDNAKALDRAYQKEGLLGPLHCVPVILKDNIDTEDSASTSGSLSLLGSQPTDDAFVVKRLREAGAIILGKASMDEFAAGSSGISSRTGRTGNAFDPTQNPGGSSGGTAAAVSAGFALLGVGTDNAGSIRTPASYNGLYGLRPSLGLLSESGIFPRGVYDAEAGPMARSVADLSTMLTVMAARDTNDSNTHHAKRAINYRKQLDTHFLKGKRIGVVRTAAGRHLFSKKYPKANRQFDAAIARFKSLGATVMNVDLPDFKPGKMLNIVREIEDINRYLSSFPSTRKNISDICQSGRTEVYGIKIACAIKKKLSQYQSAPASKHIVAQATHNRATVLKVMKENHLNALLLPNSIKGTASYDFTMLNTGRAPIASNTGLPDLAFPVGYSHDNPAMPIGMHLVGKMYDEQTLLNLAASFEAGQTLRTPQLGAVNQSPLKNYSIPQLNHLYREIGYLAYKKVLAHGNPEDLTPKNFNRIVRQVIQKDS